MYTILHTTEHLKGRGESTPKPANTIVKFLGFDRTGRMLPQSYNGLGSSVLQRFPSGYS